MYEEEYTRPPVSDRPVCCRLCGPEGAASRPMAERKRKEE